MSIVDDAFASLDDWRYLPSIQLELRADALFSIYLADLLEQRFGFEVAGLVPEFPLHKAPLDSVQGTNQLYNVDYVTKTKGSNYRSWSR